MPAISALKCSVFIKRNFKNLPNPRKKLSLQVASRCSFPCHVFIMLKDKSYHFREISTFLNCTNEENKHSLLRMPGKQPAAIKTEKLKHCQKYR